MLSLYPKDKLAKDVTVPSYGSGFPRFTLAHNIESPGAEDGDPRGSCRSRGSAYQARTKGILGRVFGIFC